MYKNVFKQGKTIIKSGVINWKHFQLFVKTLSDMERNLIIDYNNTIGRLTEKYKDNSKVSLYTKDDKILYIPIHERQIERYINPTEYGWESRYYKTLFDITNTQERVNSISINYLEGLEWVWKYYNGICKDWQWKYKYNYPPLLTDLRATVPYFETEFIVNSTSPVSEEVQLSYVLPRDKLYLLGNLKKDRLLIKCDGLYPNEYRYRWAYCKYFWESHIDLPEIDINKLSI